MSSETRFDENEVYDILRNERRRHVLRYLVDDGDASTIADIADHIAEIESGESPPPSDTRQSVYVSLHQTHLPKLDGLGVVEYDREERTVRLLEGADEVLRRLEGPTDADATPLAWVFGVAVVGFVVAVGALLAAPGLAGGLGAAALGVVTAVAGALYVHERE
jgi:hypothetical protein